MNINKKNNISQKNVKNINQNEFFEGNHLYIYLYKKAEKLASALYIVTNLIDKEEKLKGLLREKSINIFSEIMELQKMSLINNKPSNNTILPERKYTSFDLVLSDITEIISFLKIANISGHVSEMNFNVLQSEYIDIGNLIKTRKEDLSTDNIRLPKSFFEVPNLYETHTQKQGILKTKENISIKDISNNIKDIKNKQNNIKQTSQKNFKTKSLRDSFIKDTSNFISKPKDSIHLKTADIRHNSRRNTILELLQNKSFITVKDVTDAIHGCSSKTLQRELLSLVREGILNKKGERRWSTYSLA